MFARIAGVGSFLPGSPVSNDDLAQRGLDTSDEWIATRTGIRSRHLADSNLTSSELAFEASLRALEAAGTNAAEIDLIVVATSTPDYIFPSTACLLQGKLGNVGAMTFDVQAVCSGFVYALSVADKFIRSGSHKKALVVGAEVFSRILDWQDRTTCVLFGDGAGAVGVDIERQRLCHADRIGDLDHAALGQPRSDDLHCCITGDIGRTAIDFGRVLAGKGTAAMRSRSAIGIDDDLPSGKAGIPEGSADHEFAGRIDVILIDMAAVDAEAVDHWEDDQMKKLIP